MNETAIVKFLAEQMGWEIKDRYKNLPHERPSPILWYWDGGMLVMLVKDFDPINLLEHAFMVEDIIYKMDISYISNYIRKLIAIVGEETDNTDTHIWTLYFMSIAFVVHASPKQRTLAAARALATDEQIVEFGL